MTDFSMTDFSMTERQEAGQEKTPVTAWLRALVVALLLSVALGWMIYDRTRILRHGHEVVLQTRPVDPRHLLLGHYARLGYDINRIPAEKVDGLRQWCGKRVRPAGSLPPLDRGAALRGRPVLVALRKGEDGFWHFAGASLHGLAAMKEGIAPADAVIIAGRVRNGRCVGTLWVEYGIERFYAPKDKALALERMAGRAGTGADRRQRPMGVILRVHPGSGKALIAGLMIDGKKVYEEPLF